MMPRSIWCSVVAALNIAPALSAQTPIADSAVYARAQHLVAESDAAKGRALVDSMLGAIATSSPRYAEALFWHASLASAAVDAERDYRRIAVEYSLSPRVPDALTRLAQLELARGDRMLAARHLERLLREYPPPQARATAWYWLARIGFEDSDVARACIALDSARILAPLASAELANQIRYDSGRCLTRAASTAPATNPSPAPLPRAVSAPASAGAAPRAAKAMYTVQVGAFPTRAAADQLRVRLSRQGVVARIVPAGRIFRVRVGRYETRADVERAAGTLRARKIDAWIVDAEPAG